MYSKKNSECVFSDIFTNQKLQKPQNRETNKLNAAITKRRRPPCYSRRRSRSKSPSIITFFLYSAVSTSTFHSTTLTGEFTALTEHKKKQAKVHNMAQILP